MADADLVVIGRGKRRFLPFGWADGGIKLIKCGQLCRIAHAKLGAFRQRDVIIRVKANVASGGVIIMFAITDQGCFGQDVAGEHHAAPTNMAVNNVRCAFFAHKAFKGSGSLKSHILMILRKRYGRRWGCDRLAECPDTGQAHIHCFAQEGNLPSGIGQMAGKMYKLSRSMTMNEDNFHRLFRASCTATDPLMGTPPYLRVCVQNSSSLRNVRSAVSISCWSSRLLVRAS